MALFDDASIKSIASDAVIGVLNKGGPSGGGSRLAFGSPEMIQEVVQEALRGSVPGPAPVHESIQTLNQKFVNAAAAKQPKNAFVRNAIIGPINLVANDIISLGARFLGQSEVADTLNMDSQFLSEVARQADRSSIVPDDFNAALRGAMRSIGTLALSAPAGLPGIIGTFAAVRGNQAITEGKEAGLAPDKVRNFAIRAAAIEGVITGAFSGFGRVPGLRRFFGGGLESQFGKKIFKEGLTTAARRIGRATYEELPEEMIIEALDNVNQALSGVNPDATSMENMAETMKQVILQTILAVGIVGGARELAAPRRPPERSSEELLTEAEARVTTLERKRREARGGEPSIEDLLTEAEAGLGRLEGQRAERREGLGTGELLGEAERKLDRLEKLTRREKATTEELFLEAETSLERLEVERAIQEAERRTTKLEESIKSSPGELSPADEALFTDAENRVTALEQQLAEKTAPRAQDNAKDEARAAKAAEVEAAASVDQEIVEAVPIDIGEGPEPGISEELGEGEVEPAGEVEAEGIAVEPAGEVEAEGIAVETAGEGEALEEELEVEDVPITATPPQRPESDVLAANERRRAELQGIEDAFEARIVELREQGATREQINADPELDKLIEKRTATSARPLFAPASEEGALHLDNVVGLAVRTGQWTRNSIDSAARWVFKNVGRAASFVETRLALVKKFGQQISSRVAQIFQAFRSQVGEFIRSERGALALGDLGAAPAARGNVPAVLPTEKQLRKQKLPLLIRGKVEKSLEAVFGRKANPTSADLGQALGAPKKRKGKEDLLDKDVEATSFREIQSRIKLHMNDRRWYERFADFIYNRLGLANLREFEVLWGISSGQTPVEINLQDTIAVMVVARRLGEVGAGNFETLREAIRLYIKGPKHSRETSGGKMFLSDRQIKSIAEFYRTGVWEAGLKTATYGSLTGRQARRLFDPRAVIDRHVLRGLGFIRKQWKFKKKAGVNVLDSNGEPIKTLQDDTSLTDEEFRYSQYVLAKAAQRLGITPSQAQAALWAYAKQNLSPISETQKENFPGTVESAESMTETEMAKLEPTLDRDAPFSETVANGEIKTRATTKEGAFNTLAQVADLFKLAKKIATRLVVSSVPGGALQAQAPEGWTEAQAVELNEEAIRSRFDERGIFFAAEFFGLPIDVSVGMGSWGQIEPNYIIRPLLGNDDVALGIASIEAAVMLQDAAGKIRMDVQGGSPALVLSKAGGVDFTSAEMLEIMNAVNPKRDVEGFNFTADGDQIIFAFDGKDGAQYEAWAQRLSSAINAGGITHEQGSATTDAEFFDSGRYRENIEKAWHSHASGGSPGILARHVRDGIQDHAARLRAAGFTIDEQALQDYIGKVVPFPDALAQLDAAPDPDPLVELNRQRAEALAGKRDERTATVNPEGEGMKSGDIVGTDGPAPLGIRVPLIPKRLPGAVVAAREVHDLALGIAIDDMVDRVERGGLKPGEKPGRVARLTGKALRKAIDLGKQHAGRMSKLLREFQTLAGQLTGKRGKASRRAAAVTRHSGPGTEYATSNNNDHIESKLDLKQNPTLTPEDVELVEAARRLIDLRGKLFMGIGLKLRDPVTGLVQLFKAIPGGKVAPRIPTEEFYALLRQGAASPAWRPVINAFAHLNGIDPQAVEETFNQMRDEIIAESVPAALTHTQAEFRRGFKKVPVEVYVNNDTVRLYEYRPFEYMTRLVEHGAARMGVIEAIGQDIREPGEVSPVTRLRQAYGKETGSEAKLTQALRAVHGLPIDEPLVAPGTARARVARAARHVGGVVKNSQLSASVVPNMFEFVGNIRAFGGTINLLKAFYELSPLNARRHQLIVMMERLRLITSDIANRSFDPNRKAESISRILRENIGRFTGFRGINELQEAIAARVGQLKTAEMRKRGGQPIAQLNGRAVERDAFDLQGVGLSLAQSRRLATGRGSLAEYRELNRRVAGALIGSPLNKAERSRAENHPLFRVSFAFTSYAQAKLRSFSRQGGAWIKQTEDIWSDTSLTPAQKWSRLSVPTQRFSNYMIGTSAAGAGSYFLLALATGGLAGLKIAWEEAKDRPIAFLRDSFLYAMVAGPYGAVLRSLDNGSFGDLWKTIYPAWLGMEVLDATRGHGAYQNQDMPDRMLALGKRLFPASRVASGAASIVGFNAEAMADDQAVKGYWRWRFDELPPPRFEYRKVTAEEAEFRTGVREAMRAIERHGPMEEILEGMRRALKVESRTLKSLAGALRFKKLLTRRQLKARSDAEFIARLREVRDRLGDGAFQRLLRRDALLELWASSIG